MTIRSKIKAQKVAIGTWNLFSDPSAVEVMCAAGFDYIIHDMEHGAHSLDNVQNMVRAAEAHGKNLLLRPPGIDFGLIQRALDAGCHGLMVPNIQSVDDAKAVVRAAYFPPVGDRGLSPYTRAMGYKGTDVPKNMAAWNEACILGILIEGRAGIDALPEILSSCGQHLDIVYIGLYDLAKQLDSTDNLMSVKMQDSIKKIASVMQSHGVNLGMLANSAESLQFAQDMGARLIAYKNDTAILHDAVAAICADLKRT